MSGKVKVAKRREFGLPAEGGVARYIFTSAQNNTRLHDNVWRNLHALADHYNADVIVSRYYYETRFHEDSAKPASNASTEEKWYDPRIADYVLDESALVAPGLVWCGELQILPTAKRPLSGFESYTGRLSSIIPHAKFAMQSVASGKGEGTKMLYTTGTVTKRNYIQKKAGQTAQFHHGYGAVLVEVNSKGNWWVRQLNADSSGTIYDLDVKVRNSRVTTGHRVEAITWGDIHARQVAPEVKRVAGEMLDALKPKYQFMHDVLDFRARNHHDRDDGHKMFEKWVGEVEDWHVVEEIREAAELVGHYSRPTTQTIVVNSNHDQALKRWLNEADFRRDPANALFFLKANVAIYEAILARDKSFDVFEWAMRRAMGVFYDQRVRFLKEDESFITCHDANGGIENGNHGHRGPNGMRGNPLAFARMGRKQNIGHLHTSGIYDGTYVAGTSSLMDLGYNRGPSSWSWSHIVTYANGKRAMITMYGNQWRA